MTTINAKPCTREIKPLSDGAWPGTKSVEKAWGVLSDSKLSMSTEAWQKRKPMPSWAITRVVISLSSVYYRSHLECVNHRIILGEKTLRTFVVRIKSEIRLRGFIQKTETA